MTMNLGDPEGLRFCPPGEEWREPTEEEVRAAELTAERLRSILMPHGPAPKGSVDRVTAFAKEANVRGARTVPHRAAAVFAILVCVGLVLSAGGAFSVGALLVALFVAAGCGRMFKDVLEYDDLP
jgi:hypothetical protein